MSVTQCVRRSPKAAVSRYFMPQTDRRLPAPSSLLGCSFASNVAPKPTSTELSLTHFSGRLQGRCCLRPSKATSWFVLSFCTSPPLSCRDPASCHCARPSSTPAHGSASSSSVPSCFFGDLRRDHLSTASRKKPSQWVVRPSGESREDPESSLVRQTLYAEGGSAVSSPLGTQSSDCQMSPASAERARQPQRVFERSGSSLSTHTQERRTQAKERLSGASQVEQSSRQQEHRQAPSCFRPSSNSMSRGDAAEAQTAQPRVSLDHSYSTTPRPSSERGSVFLSLCEMEERVRGRIAVLHSQGQWARRVRFKDWKSAQVPQLYDGPFWFKFWHRKKRPGARG